MNKKTLEIVTKCYGDSNDGIAVVKNNTVIYCNRAMTDIAQRDIIGAHINDVFDIDFINTFILLPESSASVSDCIEIFGRTVDVRSFEINRETVIVFSRPDNIDELLRNSDESFAALRNAYTRMINSLTVVDSSS